MWDRYGFLVQVFCVSAKKLAEANWLDIVRYTHKSHSSQVNNRCFSSSRWRRCGQVFTEVFSSARKTDDVEVLQLKALWRHWTSLCQTRRCTRQATRSRTCRCLVTQRCRCTWLQLLPSPSPLNLHPVLQNLHPVLWTFIQSFWTFTQSSELPDATSAMRRIPRSNTCNLADTMVCMPFTLWDRVPNPHFHKTNRKIARSKKY